MKKISLILTIVALAIIGCNREIPAPSEYPSKPTLPEAPRNLVIAVADQSLQLTWEAGDNSTIDRYRIYRGDSLTATFSLIDSSETANYTDANLLNGRLYYYQVSAVDTLNRSGERSAIAWGAPNLYAVIINDGDSTTNSRDVTLTLVAPATSLYMRIANTADYAGSSWESFVSTKAWVLPQGAGSKTVYAMFRDSYGNSTTGSYSDNILLQMLPYQYSISAEQDALFAYSRDIALALTAPSGTSFMKISTDANFAGAEWEAYSASKNWHVSSGIDNGELVIFFARFRDQNLDSVAVQASDSITMAFADPIELFPVIQPFDHYQTINLSWTATRSEDFQSYRVFRRRGSAAVDTLISNIASSSTTTYLDSIGLSNLPDTTTQSVYYMVRFLSAYGDSSDSDTIRVNLKNTQPTAISCFVSNVNYVPDSAHHVTNMTATLGWSRSEISDFTSYIVYENTSPTSGTAHPVSYIYDRTDLSHDIVKNNVDTTRVFYYWLKVSDQGGQSSQFSAPDSVKRR
jgi:hypothetical protein